MMHFTRFSPLSTHPRSFTDQFWHSQNSLISEKNYLYVLREPHTKYERHLMKAQESKPSAELQDVFEQHVRDILFKGTD